MAKELELKPGQTPLDPDEVAGLKPRHIAAQGELDEWEAQNILKATLWINRQKKLDVLNDHFCRELHTKMFSDTWKWAGTFRKSDKNIGLLEVIEMTKVKSDPPHNFFITHPELSFKDALAYASDLLHCAEALGHSPKPVIWWKWPRSWWIVRWNA